jgi:hypothetical protein
MAVKNKANLLATLYAKITTPLLKQNSAQRVLDIMTDIIDSSINSVDSNIDASSVQNYFLNNTASDIGGVYLVQSQTPSLDAITALSTASVIDGDTLQVFATESGKPALLYIGNGTIKFYFNASQTAGTKNSAVKFEIYKRVLAGTETLLATSATSDVLTAVDTDYAVEVESAEIIPLLVTDRIVTKVKAVITGAGTAPTIKFNVEGSEYSRTTIPIGSVDLTQFEKIINKDATGGYTGLTLFKINFKNAANTFTSFFTNANTAARTYTFQDRNGTIADDTDLGLKSPLASPTFTGTLTTPAIIVSSETASTIASFDASKNVKSLATATYPNLTELSYVKGVTSAVQTQINTKALTTLVGSPCEIQAACSDLTTSLTTGTSKGYFRMPHAMTVTGVRASVLTAPTGGTLLTIDINDSGTTILSTKLTFDASEKTTTTAATPAVISDSALSDDAEITIDIDAVGSTIAGAGLIVTIIGTRA